ILHRFGWLGDESWLAINLDPNIGLALRRDPALKELALRRDDSFAPVCHTALQTQGRPGQNPIIALSFTEMLERLLAKGGRAYWLDQQFASYGDAEQYTRRD